MQSKWFEYKNKAISLRQQGLSIKTIEKQLSIPRSTLSGWFRDIKLTAAQKQKLKKDWKTALIKARVQAIAWHNAQRELRILNAKNEADKVLNNINTNNKITLELALSMLYLGEGSKSTQTSMGNSNPEIVKFFLKCLQILYEIKPSDLKYYLHLRSDQDGEKMKKYWSNKIKVPVNKFSYTKDRRTAKSKTFQNYKGVCVVHVGRIAIQRKLGFISSGFCEKILAL